MAPWVFDDTFNDDGRAFLSFGDGPATVEALAIQPDGKIVVAGKAAIVDEDPKTPDQTDFALARYLSDGTLDRSFGNNGKVLTGLSPGDDAIHDIVLQGDGKITAVGYATTNSTRNFAIARYNADGTLDATFSGDGKLIHEFGLGNDEAHAAAIAANGKIVVGGEADGHAALMRLEADGSFDASFNGDGKRAYFATSGYDGAIRDMLPLGDERILATGNYKQSGAVFKVEANGALDADFGNDGVAPVPGQSQFADAPALLPGGSIVVTVSADELSGSPKRLVKLTTAGKYDTSFNDDGQAIVGSSVGRTQLLAQGDGKIVQIGTRRVDAENNVVYIARFNADGTKDTDYGVNGGTSFPFNGDPMTLDVAFDSNGYIVIASTSVNGSDRSFGLMRVKTHSGVTLDDVVNVSPNLRTTPVSAVDVVFSSPIDLDTFTRDDVSLTYGSRNIPLTDAVKTSRVSGNTYRISGLSSLTEQQGKYILTVDGLGIKDASGKPVGGARSDDWEVGVAPKITSIYTSTSRGIVYNATVRFNSRIERNSFKPYHVTLQRDNGPDLVKFANQTVSNGGSDVYINNLQSITQTPGTYVLTVSGWFTGTNGLLAKSSITTKWVVNPAPDLRLNAGGGYIEGAGQILAPKATIQDANNKFFKNGSLTVSFNRVQTGDELSVRNVGTGKGQIGVDGENVTYGGYVVGTISGGTGSTPLKISFNDKMPKQGVQALVRNISYSGKVGSVYRQIYFQVNDGSGGVSAKPYVYLYGNYSPQLSLGGKKATLADGSAAIAIAPQAVISDPQAYYGGGSVVVNITENAKDGDRLGVRNVGTGKGQIGVDGANVTYGGTAIGTISGGVNGAPLKIDFNDAAPKFGVQTLIRNVTFASTSDEMLLIPRTFKIVLTDGLGGIDTESKRLVNWKPTLTLDGASTYIDGDGPLVLAPGAKLKDSNNLFFNDGVLTVTNGANADANDRIFIRSVGATKGLIGVDGANVTYGGYVIGTFSGGVGSTPLTVNFNAAAPRQGVLALLKNITFESPTLSTTATNPEDETRRLSFTLEDGLGGVSKTVFKTVNIIRDAGGPFIGIGGVASYREDQPPVLIAANAYVVLDAVTVLDGAVLTVEVAQHGTASDRLSLRSVGSGVDQVGVDGTDVTFGGVVVGTLAGGEGTTALTVTFNDAASVAAVRAIIRGVQFADTAESPTLMTRAVSFVFTDGEGNESLPAVKPVNVLGVNDVPSIDLAGEVTYTIGNAPVNLASNAVFTDEDEGNYKDARLEVTILKSSFYDLFDVSGDFSRSGTQMLFKGTAIGTVIANGRGSYGMYVTFNEKATAAVVQALIRSMQYRTDPAYPQYNSPGVRFATFYVTDPQGAVSQLGSVKINVLRPATGA